MFFHQLRAPRLWFHLVILWYLSPAGLTTCGHNITTPHNSARQRIRRSYNFGTHKSNGFLTFKVLMLHVRPLRKLFTESLTPNLKNSPLCFSKPS